MFPLKIYFNEKIKRPILNAWEYPNHVTNSI